MNNGYWMIGGEREREGEGEVERERFVVCSCGMYHVGKTRNKLMLCILDRKQTQKTQRQADLRGSPKLGMSTETTDYILLEE